MKEIKFRGKRRDNGEWVYGVPYYYNSIFYMLPLSNTFVYGELDGLFFGVIHNVIPETVGQYTGLKDKNGKEIYEGDIVEDIMSEASNSWGVITLEPTKWEGEPLIFGNEDAILYKGFIDKGFIELINRGRIKIIGNIFDNPELLEEMK